MKYRLFGSLMLLAVAACSSSDNTTPPPTSESLFDTAPAPTPNTLRGLWSLGSQTQSGVVIEARIRFIESYAVGAAKCTPPNNGTPVIAGKAIGLDTSALDAQKGQLTMGALVFQATQDNITCGGGIQNSGTFDFTIDGTALTLTLAGAQGSIPLTKIGD